MTSGAGSPRTDCRDEFVAHGLDPTIVQRNVSVTSQAGTIRGMHYQIGAYAETKLVRCVRGAIHDVVIDLRPDSATLLQHVVVELDASTHRALDVPKACAHGFQTLVDDSEVEYCMGAVYEPTAGRGYVLTIPRCGCVGRFRSQQCPVATRRGLRSTAGSSPCSSDTDRPTGSWRTRCRRSTSMPTYRTMNAGIASTTATSSSTGRRRALSPSRSSLAR